MKDVADCKIYIQISSNIRISIAELLYFLAFLLYLSYSMINTTMFNIFIPSRLGSLILLCSTIIIIYKILFIDKYSLKQLFAIGIFMIIIILSAFVSDYKNLIYMAFMVIGAKNIEFKKIVKFYMWVVISITLLAMVASFLGVIEQIITYRNGKARYAFGSIYCTDFAAHIFYIVVSYCYLKKNDIKYIAIIICTLLGWFIGKFSGARLDSICIYAVCLYFTYLKIRKKKIELRGLNKITRSVLIFSMPLCAFISIIGTSIYNPSNSIMFKINSLLSNRLKYGKLGIDSYGFKLLGQQVQMNGNGGANSIVENYFFIDSAYLYVALRYGIILLIMLCIYFIALNNKMIKKRSIFIPISIAFIAINSIVAHHLTDLSYNIFLLCFFAKIDID